jgi:ribose transport system permease protein
MTGLTTDHAVSDEASQDRRSGARKAVVYISSHYATLVLTVILCLVFSFTISKFLTQTNLTATLAPQAVTAILALAALMPLVVGEFDLSLGYNLGFSSMVGAWLAGRHWSDALVILGMLVVSAVVGLVNGVLIEYMHIGAFIATLAVGTVISALTEGLSGGAVLFSNIPAFLNAIADDNFLGLSWAVWIAIVLAIIVQYCFQHTPVGRRLYAIGGSQWASYLAGVRTRQLKVGAFVASGVLVGFAAAIHLGQAGAAVPSYGPDLLLPAYGAAFLGITAYRPGYYNVPGTIIAILLLAVGFDGLSLLGVPYWTQPLFDGLVLLAAVMLARRESRNLTASS